ncbi:MAG TPA: cupin domain-containing protein [Chloroflexota bacterium]|jgi:uncharacterized RmlC-like cupin family protein
MEGIKLVRPADRDRGTAQTSGMAREAGISAETAGVRTIWSGYVRTPPGTASGAHHHGDCETAIYILSGHVRFRFGAKLEEYVDARAGDFVSVPPNIVHTEENLSQTEPVELIVSRGCTSMLVVNVPDPRG